jgi:hypothetical protein
LLTIFGTPESEEGQAGADNNAPSDVRYVRGNALNKGRGFNYAVLWQAFTLTVSITHHLQK